MMPFPHQYLVEVSAEPSGSVALTAESVPEIASAPPVEFDGPGDQWSPEALFVGAVVDCFALTFRALARASKLEWTKLLCHAEGTLDRADRVTRFVEIRILAYLELPQGVHEEAGRRLLERAESSCPVSNSVTFPVELKTRVSVPSLR